MSFETLGLNSDLLRAIEGCGFTTATDIQREAIPVVLQGRDLMASAQTGTGKTAAFVLPALQRLAQPSAQPGNGPRVLVLTPTRELATQVTDTVRQLSRFTRVALASVVGGVPYPPQIKALHNRLDLLVATPGRLMDHMERGRIDFSRLEMLVLDEADRMLDMGFLDAVRAIADSTPATRQTLLFSATLEGRVLEVAQRLLREPARVQLAANHVRNENITQQLHQADDLSHKHKLLRHILADQSLSQAVIFTATKQGADDLAQNLAQEGYPTAALHGDMHQRARQRTVEQMRRNEYRLLVATDVAARGLDIKGITHVINFDLPMVAEDYIHRIGRTGRGGASGTAISLIGPKDWSKLSGIERLTGAKLDRAVVPGLEPRSGEPRRGSGRPDANRSRPGQPGKRFGQGGKPFNSDRRPARADGKSFGDSRSSGNKRPFQG